ncbi:MAG: hypothetical protein Q4D06_09885, partial [Coriobacteriia bacterium]|nr:hypothetical protein [Coriobacteriia bacterium]
GLRAPGRWAGGPVRSCEDFWVGESQACEVFALKMTVVRRMGLKRLRKLRTTVLAVRLLAV